MTDRENKQVQLFENQRIRTAWDEKAQQWYFSVVDVVQVLTDSADFHYKCTDFYAHGDEYGVLWNDPALAIPWGAVAAPVVSAKDAKLPRLADLSPEQLPEFRG